MANKTLQKIIILTILALGGCSAEKEIPTPDNLIGVLQSQYNRSIVLLQKITDIAYNPVTKSAVIALEPAMPGQANIIKIRFDPEASEGNRKKADLAKITNGPIRHIRISGKYTAFTGRSRELVILKDELDYAKFDLSDEITCIEFDEKNGNLLVAGDRRGKLSVIDLEKSVILNTVRVFDDEIASLAFYKDGQFLVSGNGSRFAQVDAPSGKIVRRIETNGLKEKLYHATGIKHCIKDRINRVLYIASEDKIVTTHGWDYCRDFRMAIWDASSGNLVKEITRPRYPVFHMVWVPGFRSLAFVDHGQNLWRLSFSDFKLSDPKYLPQTQAKFNSLGTKNEKVATNFGNIQSLVSVPGTDYLLTATGSYFKGGAGVLLTQLTTDSMKHMAHLTLSYGVTYLFINEELLGKAQSYLE